MPPLRKQYDNFCRMAADRFLNRVPDDFTPDKTCDVGPYLIAVRSQSSAEPTCDFIIFGIGVA